MTTTQRAIRVASLLVFAASLWLAGAGEARACGSCYGLADGPMIDAARLGIWFMLGTVALVQGGFAAFFVYLHRRASQSSRPGLPPVPDPVGGRER
jgi:hypothetical protein